MILSERKVVLCKPYIGGINGIKLYKRMNSYITDLACTENWTCPWIFQKSPAHRISHLTPIVFFSSFFIYKMPHLDLKSASNLSKEPRNKFHTLKFV